MYEKSVRSDTKKSWV